MESQVSMLESSRRSYQDHSHKIRLQDTDFVRGLEKKVETQAAKLENQKNQLHIYNNKWNAIMATCESVSKNYGMYI